MKKSQFRLNFDRCLAWSVGIAMLLLHSQFASADSYEFAHEEFDPNSLVEVRVTGNATLPYADRRTTWSWRFNLTGEAFYPSNYVSAIDSSSYSSLFGTNQGVLGTASLGAQYNSKLGAIYLDLEYGGGNIPSSSTANLNLQKWGIATGVMFDTLFPDPWVSPYLGMQLIYFGYNEVNTGTGSGNGTTSSGVTEITTGIVAGISIHLNKLDPAASKDAFNAYGIKNTFVDIFGVMYNTSNNANDPDLSTNFNIGGGFHVEF